MRNTFLTGSFLPGYSSVFRYEKSALDNPPSLPLEILADRFQYRAKRFHDRGTSYSIGIQAGIAVALILVSFGF